MAARQHAFKRLRLLIWAGRHRPHLCIAPGPPNRVLTDTAGGVKSLYRIHVQGRREKMADRTNETWLADLQADGLRRTAALEDLRTRLVRGVYFYLSHDRSDLSGLASIEIERMAEDFVQEALLKVLHNLHTFRGESQFTTWAAKIATRVAISELRKARYRDYSLDHLTADGEIMPSITSLALSPQEAPQPESYTEQQSVLAVITRGFETVLTQRQRVALTAYTVDGVPMEEIARRMGTNRNALYKLVHDARVKLKRFLEAEGLSLDYILDLFGEE